MDTSNVAIWNSENSKKLTITCNIILIPIFFGKNLILFKMHKIKPESFWLDNFVNFVFSCSRCEKYFPRKSDLSAHMSQHKAVDTKKYTCDECGKIWSTKYHLKLHKRSHEIKGEKIFPCQHCNRKLVAFNSLFIFFLNKKVYFDFFWLNHFFIHQIFNGRIAKVTYVTDSWKAERRKKGNLWILC